MLNGTDQQIVATFASEIRGLSEFYALAVNVSAFHRTASAARHSLLKTLAAKHRSSTVKMRARCGTHVNVGGRDYRCIEVGYARKNGMPGTARFGPIRLIWQRKITTGKPPWRPVLKTKEVVKRLKRGICELCKIEGRVSVHQIRSLADLTRFDQRLDWVTTMQRMRRITLFACEGCHEHIHQSVSV